ncbi:MAG: hypothetical protein ACOYPR_21840, partial [Saprospiraceae bacterium]
RNDRDRFIYANVEVIEQTLKALKIIALENEGIVDEMRLQEMIDMVYPDFTKEDRQKFEDTCLYLKSSLERLAPMQVSKQTEEDFYKQFDGAKVLPIELYTLFIERLQRFDFIGAQRLKVGIRKGELARWTRSGIIAQRKYFLEHTVQTGNKLIEIDFQTVHLPYSSVLGLQKTAEPISADFMDERIL